MGMMGMDVDQIRSIANQLKSQASQIDGVIGAIDGLIGQIQGAWVGEDSTQFQDWWNSQHKPALQAARDSIDGLGQSALNNADQQEQISAGS